MEQAWPAFSSKRAERLAQQRRFGSAAEKVAEGILEDLFTAVLDWGLDCFNNQVGRADIVLTHLGIKRLVVEAKRPGALSGDRAMEHALEQVCGYAARQKVRCVAVSDGTVLWAWDLVPGGQRARVAARLDASAAPAELWWLSVDGIYRDRPDLPPGQAFDLAGQVEGDASFDSGVPEAELLHPKYRLPAACFAYVEDPLDPRSWHLPYLRADGTPDAARLPKAVQAVLSNYRGARARLPEEAVPEVLVRLARAGRLAGRLPAAGPRAPRAWVLLQEALDQLGRLGEVLGD
jgi:hypothetical protein